MKTTPLTIEQKASAATADDPNSVQALADEVFNLNHVFRRMASVVEGMVKDRLVGDEILYRQGKAPGVQERDIVDTLNHLAERFGGPPYSKTSLSQVRVLRMWMALCQPNFMGAGVAKQNAAVGESISSAMSPLQAAHLIATLIDQKFINPDFQVSPEEWEKNSPPVEEKIKQRTARARATTTGQSSANVSLDSYSPDKRRELEQTLYPSIWSLGTTDALILLEQAFEKLHI
jgi:hypothetical protein